VSPRPTIFISAVSRELKSARQLVANTLTFLGYEPVWQDIFGTEQGDLRGMLRRQIDECKGVVQLVGYRYGAEPPTIDEQFGRVSYTQYEALYAKQRGKKVWYLVLDENFPTDTREPESDELRELQAAYRQRLKTESSLRYSLGSSEALETSVLKLRNDLSRLRRGVKQWAAAVIVLLVILVGAVFLIESQQRQQNQQQNQQLNAIKEEMAKMRQGVTQFAEVQSKARQEQPGQNAAEVQQRTYDELAKQLGVDPKLLQEKLPQFAKELKNAPNATTYERANAAYVTKEYAEAERLALVVADEAQKATPPKIADAIKALELAGNSADSRIEYAEALQHFRDAAQLTDRARDPLGWATQQWNIAFVLDAQGKYAESEKVYRGALEEYRRARGDEDKDVLTLRNNLAGTLDDQGEYAEAEMEYRAVIKLEEKALGPEHPDTLQSRYNLANALDHQGKYAEAEMEYQAVIKLEEKVLGPEHPDTLGSRNNLAVTLYHQGKYAEAETEYRSVIKLEEKVLGPEHPQTLQSRNDLAGALDGQGKYAEAETEYRAVIKLEEKVLGPEDPHTLRSRNNLANALDDQGKYAEAEAEDRAVLKLREKVLGPEHPHTLSSRNNLANALAEQGKHAEAETEYRKVIKLKEKVLGPEHPNTLWSCYLLGLCLKAENKMDEAKEFAQRAAEGASKTLGANHPDTLKYEKLWRELQTKD
jgi:tetratricopeptide (TPR) repeat protein